MSNIIQFPYANKSIEKLMDEYNAKTMRLALERKSRMDYKVFLSKMRFHLKEISNPNEYQRMEDVIRKISDVINDCEKRIKKLESEVKRLGDYLRGNKSNIL